MSGLSPIRGFTAIERSPSTESSFEEWVIADDLGNEICEACSTPTLSDLESDYTEWDNSPDDPALFPENGSEIRSSTPPNRNASHLIPNRLESQDQTILRSTSVVSPDQVDRQDQPPPSRLETRPSTPVERNVSIIVLDQAQRAVNTTIREDLSLRRTPLDCIPPRRRLSQRISKQVDSRMRNLNKLTPSALDFLFSIPTKIYSFFFESTKAFLLGIKLLFSAKIIILVAKALRLPVLPFLGVST